MADVKDIRDSGQNWQTLDKLYKKFRHHTVAQLIKSEPNRQLNWRLEAAGIKVDLSRNLIDSEIRSALVDLAINMQLPEKVKALMAGQPVNTTEQRPAHHTALRLPLNTSPYPELKPLHKKIEALATSIRSGEWKGSDDQTITDVINIGIGGSDLGPRMACNALNADRPTGPKMHFVANVDPRDLEETLANLSACHTLIIISSKSFSTPETLANAISARQWLVETVPESDLHKHMLAISSNVESATEFGVHPDNILPMWDWVGGRYSLWSAIGLPIAITAGYSAFSEMLEGAYAMDSHFADTALDKNIPVLLALLEIWYVNFWQAKSVAVLPYSHELRLFPDYLQQLTMESNGKSVMKDGSAVFSRTCPTVWGSAGTIGQHSFHQLLHQGTELVPVDFILPLTNRSQDGNKFRHLVANCLAQSKALTEGKSYPVAQSELVDSGYTQEEARQLARHKIIPGNRPNTIIAMDQLSPHNLGALIAMYEHKVYAQSVIWNINAFDQWGVELGKQLSTPILSALATDSDNSMDDITAMWIEDFRRANDQ